MHTLFTIAKNTFTETLRQPVYAIIIGAALLLFIISPSLAMYTMSDDNKLLRELGLSTLFLTSLFIAIFSASGAVAEEMESKTITTVRGKVSGRGRCGSFSTLYLHYCPAYVNQARRPRNSKRYT